jgi:hypothetical protein
LFSKLLEYTSVNLWNITQKDSNGDPDISLNPDSQFLA